MWIRPEDLHYYEEIGFDKFKIIDRLKETKWLMNAIDAYTKRSYDGNLSDILCSFDTFEKEVPETPLLGEKDLKVDDIQQLREFWDLKPFIDNNKLKELNFLEYFVKNKIDCRNRDCNTCGYCKKIADEVVKVKGNNADNVAKNLDFIKNELINIIKN